MNGLVISLLGPLAISWHGRPLDALDYKKAQALLVYLALEGRRAHSRSRLTALLWPDLPERSARQNLSQALTTLRRAFDASTSPTSQSPPTAGAAKPLLLAGSTSVQLNPALEPEVDAQFFIALLDECELHPHRHWHTCSVCAGRLQRAVALYRGDFLADFFLADSAPFEEWALLQREHLRQRALSALERLARWAEWRDEYGQAQAYVRRQIEIDPLLESAHRDLMRLLALAGQTAAALAQYEHLRLTLSEAMGCEPEAETAALAAQIRELRPDSPGAVRHFRPPHSNIPAAPGRLIGREQELGAVCEHIRGGGWRPRDTSQRMGSAGVRLLTLVGPPGVGKTFLALQALRSLRYDFEHGAHWVELAPLTDALQVPAALAHVLGLKEPAGQTLTAALIAYLQPKHMLLALDNFEHLLAAALFVAGLLDACPGLQIMATSREALRVRAEQQLPLAPMALIAAPSGRRVGDDKSDLERIGRSPAVQLFVDRARAVRPSFTLDGDNAATVAAICKRLDGLPLALVLVAARCDTLSPAELLQGVQQGRATLVEGPPDLPERHQTLRRSIQWSYDLLHAESQHLFRHLGVFAGGFTLEAAAALSGFISRASATAPAARAYGPGSVSDLVRGLAAKSLVVRQELRGESRFSMLETIREFAFEQLTASGELDSARRQHAAYFVVLAEQAEPGLQGPEQGRWLERLEREQDNLRAALAWSLSPAGDHELGLRLAGALVGFGQLRGAPSEWRDWMEKALAATASSGPTLARVRALYGAATLANIQCDWSAGRARAQEALTNSQALGDRRQLAYALSCLGRVAWGQGRYEEWHSLYAQSTAIFREVGDRRGLAMALNDWGSIVDPDTGLAAALDRLEESVRLWRELGDAWGLARALNALGEAMRWQGDYERAAALYEESLALQRDLGPTAMVSHNLGHAALRLGRTKSANALFAGSLNYYVETAHVSGCAAALAGLAGVAGAQGRPERSTRLLGAADALLEAIGVRFDPIDQAEHDRNLAAIRAQLEPATFARIWSEGSALSLEQAVALALGR